MTASKKTISALCCFEEIFLSSAFCFAVVGDDNRIIEVNPGLEKMLGCTAAHLAGKPFTQLLAASATLPAQLAEATLKSFFSNPVFACRTRLSRSDGSVVTASLVSRRAPAGATALIELAADEQPASPDQTVQPPDEDYLENIFSTVGDGVYVTDELGIVVKANPALAKMLGYGQQELTGRHSVEFSAQADTAPEAMPQLMEQLIRDGVIENYETLWRKQDGTLLQVELKITLLKNRAGAMIGAVRDISLRKLAAAALGESELRFRVLANSATDAIIFLNSRGRIIFWNQGAEKIYGYDYKEMLGKTPEAVIPEDLRQTHLCHFLQAPGSITTIPDTTFESFGLHKDGSRFPVEVSLSSGKAGLSLFYCAIVRNISERKKVEAALRDSEERFRVLAESLPEGIIAVNGSGDIVFWNTGAQNLFGYGREEVLGKPSTLLVPERSRQAETEWLGQLRRRGCSGFKGRIIQGVARRRDGTEFADEISVGPWPTRQGLYYVAIIRDITERQKAEQALRTSEQRFKELADSLPQTVFEINLEGLITFVNRTALDSFGYAQSDIDKGMHALHIIVPEQRVLVRDNIEKVFAGESLGGQEYLALRRDGTTFPCTIHARPILFNDRAVGLRGLLIDITLRKELEEQTNTSKRLSSISALAGGVAQDFSTMLSGILGNINLAQHLSPPEERISEYLLAAERGALRAKDLTGQLIAFARGGTSLKTASSVEKLLRQSAEAALKGSNVSCLFTFAPDLGWARLDELQMRQVFMNLLINADHGMPEGGSIEITAANVAIGPGDNLPLPNGAYLKITICDQSIGILNEHLQQLFDPYFTSRQRGSGIGLATTYTIIKNHGGLITVESEFGRGTTFHIFLPAEKKQAEAPCR